MLVLTRKLSQQIKISDNITLTVLRVKGNTVRLGIEAPRDVRIVRSELPVEGNESEQESNSTSGELVLDVDSNSEEAPLVVSFQVASENEQAAPQELPTNTLATPFPQRKKFSRDGRAPLRQITASLMPTIAK